MVNTSKCLIIGGLILLGLVVYYCFQKQKVQEGFTNLAAGSIDNLGSLDGSYELIQDPSQAVPAAYFADLVDAGDQAKFVTQPAQAEESLRPFERLERLQDRNQLPLTAAHLPQYNIDTANPSSYAFSVNHPRVLLKDRQAMASDPVRGDIPIRYHPDVPLIGKSQYGRDSLRMDGYFSDHFNELYNKMTGRAFRNLPLKVMSEGTVMDYIPETN